MKSLMTRVLASIGLLLCLNGPLQALPFGTYAINNHPDGSAASPFYGLRLDGLGGGSDIWTFDFDHTDSAMFMTFSATELRIFGSSFAARPLFGTSISRSIRAGPFQAPASRTKPARKPTMRISELLPMAVTYGICVTTPNPVATSRTGHFC